MTPNIRSTIINEGIKIVSQLVKPPHRHTEPQPQAETPEEALERIYGSEKYDSGVPAGELPVKTEREPDDIATACIPCAMGHYGTCSGLLNEAMRFAKKDSASNEVIDRINMCMDELNAMERVDLRPERIADLPEWEKKLANKALINSRSLRHDLESLGEVSDLERLAASTQTTRNDIGREWFKRRLSANGISEAKLEEMKAAAAQRAAEEVEKEVVSSGE